MQFQDPMIEAYLLFYQTALQTFVHFNMFLQRENPVVPIIHAQINSFLQKLASKFLTVQAVKAANWRLHYSSVQGTSLATCR